jgi:single-stranded DNA-binding protein
MNKALLSGKIMDMKSSETKTGKPLAQFVLLVTEDFADKRVNSHFNCVAYNNMAKILITHGLTGKNIFVEGRITEV